MEFNLKVSGAVVDIDIRILMMLSDYDAFDTSTGAYMKRSSGRRKPGRKAKYYARFGKGDCVVRFTAHNNFEAASKANDLLKKKFESMTVAYQIIMVDTLTGISTPIMGHFYHKASAESLRRQLTDNAIQEGTMLEYSLDKVICN